MTTELLTKLEELDSQSVDYTDPATYTKLLGYDQESDAAAGTETTQGETEPPQASAAAAADAEAKPEASATPDAGQQTQEPEVAGVATRDGKHVIPYAVLERERERARELAAEVERLKAAGATQEEQQSAIEAVFSEEELDELSEFAPAIRKLHDAYTSLAKQVKADTEAKAAAAQRQAQEEADTQAAQLQAAIDATTLLKQWQAKGGGLWADAVALDKQLLADPGWADKPMAARFAEVERRIAAEYGIATPQPKTAAPAKAAAAAPQPKTIEPTLTDFGASGAVAVGDPLHGLSKGQMVDRVMAMDMDQIRKLAGLSY
jgi:hypothetical protein